MDEAGRRWHDMGGRPAGAAPGAEHDYALWEKRVDALVVLLGGKGLMTVDELRRALEEMGEDAFERLSYYERWIAAVAEVMIERGVVTVDELGRRMAEIAERGETYGAAQGPGGTR